MDDRVRGGSSQSYLSPHDHVGSARFYGNLDTKTLGGAGFASQSTMRVSPSGDEKDPIEPTWNLADSDGLLLGLDSGDNKTYTLTLKDEIPGKRSDGRMQSGISWEADFEMPADHENDEDGPISPIDNLSKGSNVLIRIPWANFRATYRGRDKPDAKPLDTTNIRRFSLMARSFFTKQDGDFELTINYIAAYRSSHN